MMSEQSFRLHTRMFMLFAFASSLDYSDRNLKIGEDNVSLRKR